MELKVFYTLRYDVGGYLTLRHAASSYIIIVAIWRKKHAFAMRVLQLLFPVNSDEEDFIKFC